MVLFFKKCVLCVIPFLLISCSRVMGWSAILWDLPERGLRDGDIVPVYIRSNISRTYVISLAEGGERFEVPLWQITEPESRSGAQRTAERYAEFRHQYASVRLDGLPIRAEPSNLARQVYRLREGEVIKLLYKGTGDAVMSGQTALEGDWLRVLTQDGTQGWCFSYNLEQFETDAGGNRVDGIVVAAQEEDETLKNVIAKTWWPDYYRGMIDQRRIDLSRMDASYCFVIENKDEVRDENGAELVGENGEAQSAEVGERQNRVSLNLPDAHGFWQYEDIVKTASGAYTFTGAPIRIEVRRDDYIVVTYTDESGRPRDFNFITLDEDEDVAEIVEAEKTRRAEVYNALYQFGPDFRSASYGQLRLGEDGSFTWSNFGRLVPSVISARARGGGTIEINYFVGNALSSAYDGILSFRFEGMTSEVNFLYRLDENGVRLEDASGAQFEGNTLTRRGLSPLVIYFERD